MIKLTEATLLTCLYLCNFYITSNQVYKPVFAFQNYTLYYDYNPNNLGNTTISQAAFSLTNIMGERVTIRRLLACEEYYFTVRDVTVCHGPLSDLASVHTDYGKLIHDTSNTSL